MKCVKCGHELLENASFCNQCGEPVLNKEVKNENAQGEKIINKKQWNDKYTILLLIVVLVVSASGGLLYKNLKTDKNSNDVESYSTEDYVDDTNYLLEDTDSVEEIDLPEETIEEETIMESLDVDVEQEVLWIREKYNDIVENIAEDQYEEYSLQDGIIAYCDDSELQAVVVSKNVNQNSYRRFYYYCENELIFAYYEGNDAHRLYFYDEHLMRWRYSKDATNAQDAINYDLDRTEKYLELESAALGESDDLKEKVLSMISIPFNMSKIEKISATSELAEYNMVHSAERIADGDSSTAWVEGVAGMGVGEMVSIYFDGEYLIQGISIGAGYQKNMDLYDKNSRPAEICISFSDGTYEVHTLKDINDYQDVVFDKVKYTDYISLTIEAVYPGSKYEDTVISEVYIY